MRDHAAVGDDDELVDGKGVLEALDLGGEGCRVGGVALIDRDRDRTATGIGQKPVVDLQCPLLAVAAVAAPGEWAGRAFIIAR